LLWQAAAVTVAIAWSAAGSALCFVAVKRVTVLRFDREREREGLDLSDHGERAYNY
jgi:Amt family ammonium transporter